VTKSPVLIQEKQTKFSFSLGVAISPDDSENSLDIVKFSDVTKYAAKSDKDTNYKCYDKSMLKRFSD